MPQNTVMIEIAAMSFDALVRHRAEAAAAGEAKGGLAPAELDAPITWDRYASLAGSAAAYLENKGIGRGDHVAIWGQSSAAWAVWLAAAAWQGACLVAVHPNFGAENLTAALRQSQASWLIADETARGVHLAKTAMAVKEAVGLKGLTVQPGGDGRNDLSTLLDAGAVAPRPQGSPDLPLCIQFTSGSTGRPKAVLLSHRALITNAALTADAIGICAGDRIAAPLPLFHSAGLSTGLILSVVADAHWIGFHRFETQAVLQTIAAESCTVIEGVPTMYQSLLEEIARTKDLPPSLMVGVIGGAFLPPDLCRRVFDELGLDHLGLVYGQTEFAPTITATRGDEPGDLAIESAGPPLAGVSVRIADPDTGRLLGEGEVGEIQAQGPSLMSGYFGDSESTAAVTTADGWLRTGDLGQLKQGCLQVTARIKELIIRGGENISPYEVEEKLRLAAGVADACAVPMPSSHWGEEICAILTPSDPGGIDLGSIRAFAEANLPRHMRPDGYRVVDAMPLLANGKIDRIALKEAITQETSPDI